MDWSSDVCASDLWAASQPGVEHRELGLTRDRQPLDLLVLGEGPKKVWLYARQHPGESMAEWWMEGALERLCDEEDAVARLLRREATFYIVPNMNPDGSRRGHLRTNAVGINLNRDWRSEEHTSALQSLMRISYA